MELNRNGTQASYRGLAEYFTGTVRVDPLFAATAPSRVSAAAVTEEQYRCTPVDEPNP